MSLEPQRTLNLQSDVPDDLNKPIPAIKRPSKKGVNVAIHHDGETVSVSVELDRLVEFSHSSMRGRFPMAKKRHYESKLSRHQKWILRILLGWELHTEKWIAAHPADSSIEGMKGYHEAGTDWQPNRLARDREGIPTPTYRADMSRALRRLEQRGLVDRFPLNEAHPHRTYRVKLSPRGLATAKRIEGWTKGSWELAIGAPRLNG
jgi:hypothetical protein